METEEAELRRRKRPTEEAGTPETSSSATIPQQLAPPEYYDYGSGEAYAQAVRTWLWAYQSWQFAQAMAPFHVHQALMNMHSSNNNRGNDTTLPSPTATSPNATVTTTTVTTNRTTTQHVVASYGRRLVAELIDFIFCFILKLGIVYCFVELDFINLDKYEKLLGDQPDLKTFIDVTQDLFPIEILSKIITSFIEAFYISYGFGVIPQGSTPGKFIMGLRVIRCDTCIALAPRDHRVLLTGVGPVSFLWSMARSLIKNFCLSFLFPICVTMYAFRFNRSFYDIASSTIVVEAPPPRNVQR